MKLGFNNRERMIMESLQFISVLLASFLPYIVILCAYKS